VNGIIVLYLFISLGLAVFVANDASKRNMNAGLWFVLTILFGVITLLIYSITVTPTSTTHHSTNRQKSARKESQTLESTSTWIHRNDRYNHADDPVIEVSDGVNEARFVIRDDEIHPQSAVYQRKYGDNWVNDAKDYLHEEFREDKA
jgi:hypothetical protein